MKKIADIMSKTGKWLLVFCFIFSVVSFPLEVLADELSEGENTYQDVIVTEDTDTLIPGESSDIQIEEPVIKINGEELTEYTIKGIEDTKVTITLEYLGETKTEVLDFSKKLYGTYQYTFTSLEEVVTINYLGNNADLLKQYENVNDLTKNISCNDVECVIGGFGADLVTVADIYTYYNLESFGSDYNVTAVVIDGEKNLLDTDTVLNGYEFKIEDNQNEVVLEFGVLVNTTPATSYIINRVGDVFVPSDGLVDVKDQEAIIDDILQENEVTNLNDINGDGILNILDATHSVFINPDLIEGEVTDVLTNTLISDKDEVLVGDTVEVKLFVTGFEQLSLYGIEGLLNYDESILELVGVDLYVPTIDVLDDEMNEESENLGYLNLANKRFAYVLKNGFNNVDEAMLTLKFEALQSGVSEVTVSNIIESYGEAFELSNDASTVSVTVIENGKGGDDEEDVNDSTTDNSPEEEVKEENTVVVRPVVLSSDYYIRNLVISGYDIDFDMYNYNYSIKVEHDVTSLDFDVLLNDSNSIYYVEGNENFKDGENLVYLVVKAENGSTRTYTIKVEKEKEVVKEEKTELDEEEIEEEEKNASKTVIIILIILVIIGLIYVIFKDDEEDKKEIEKDNQIEKKKSEKVEVKSVKVEKVKTEKTKTEKLNTSKTTTKKSTKKGTKK